MSQNRNRQNNKNNNFESKQNIFDYSQDSKKKSNIIDESDNIPHEQHNTTNQNNTMSMVTQNTLYQFQSTFMYYFYYILIICAAVLAINTAMTQKDEAVVFFNNLFNNGEIKIDHSKQIMTKEKLREIIDYKNSNLEKLKILKSESNSFKKSLSDEKFLNIKNISEQLNTKVVQLEQLINDYNEIKELRKAISDKISELEEYNMKINPDPVKLNQDILDSKSREIERMREEQNAINNKKLKLMDQISEQSRNIEDQTRMLEDSKSKKERYQRELDDKNNEIDKGKANLNDLDKIYLNKLNNIEKLNTQEQELVKQRNQTTETGLKSIMSLKELLEIEDEETYQLSQANSGITEYTKLLNNIQYDQQYGYKSKNEQEKLYDQYNSHIEEYNKIISSEDQRKQLYSIKKDKLESEVSSQELESESLENELNVIRNKLHESKDDLNKFIKQQGVRNKKSAEKEKEGVKKQLEQTSKEIEQIVFNIQKLSEEKRGLERSIDQLRKPEMNVEKAMNEISNLKKEQSKLAQELIENYSYASLNLNIAHILKCVEDQDKQLKYKSMEIEKTRKELIVLENNLNKNLN